MSSLMTTMGIYDHAHIHTSHEYFTNSRNMVTVNHMTVEQTLMLNVFDQCLNDHACTHNRHLNFVHCWTLFPKLLHTVCKSSTNISNHSNTSLVLSKGLPTHSFMTRSILIPSPGPFPTFQCCTMFPTFLCATLKYCKSWVWRQG